MQCVLELFGPLHPCLPQIVDLLQELLAKFVSKLVLLFDCFLEAQVLFFKFGDLKLGWREIRACEVRFIARAKLQLVFVMLVEGLRIFY
jgi:hypothetical protein